MKYVGDCKIVFRTFNKKKLKTKIFLLSKEIHTCKKKAFESIKKFITLDNF